MLPGERTNTQRQDEIAFIELSRLKGWPGEHAHQGSSRAGTDVELSLRDRITQQYFPELLHRGIGTPG